MQKHETSNGKTTFSSSLLRHTKGRCTKLQEGPRPQGQESRASVIKQKSQEPCWSCPLAHSLQVKKLLTLFSHHPLSRLSQPSHVFVDGRQGSLLLKMCGGSRMPVWRLTDLLHARARQRPLGCQHSLDSLKALHTLQKSALLFYAPQSNLRAILC